MKIAKTLAASLLLAGISAPVVAKDKEPVEPIVLPTAPAGMGQIVFFRPGGAGFALGCSVNENGEKVSSLGAGKYFVMQTTPGRHEFTVKSEAKDVLALEVEEGETQYAKCKIKMGIIVGRPDLAPATEDEFRKGKFKMVDAEDMGPAPGAVRPEGEVAVEAEAATE
ncbi:DUF2846 domain-containing protein [Qipengyuania sp. RANM35]|uniref:DUF2846 domain-containing protein n=1 Tax=Qipengyuania sp. RANM35 TaxID=3068635 RepID=UPI0034DB449A